MLFGSWSHRVSFFLSRILKTVFILLVGLGSFSALSAQSFRGPGHIYGPPGDDFWFSSARAVSGNGTLVGDIQNFGDKTNPNVAFFWKDGEFTQLPFTRANWISPNGRVIIGEFDVFEGPNQTEFVRTDFVRWEIDEDDVVTVTPSTDGPVIVLNEDISAFLQANGKWNDPDDLNDYRVNDVSEDQTTFVGARLFLGEEPTTRAAIWTEDSEFLIPLVPGQDVTMEALAVSGDGSIVVGKANTPFDDVEVVAFIWDETNGTRLLKTIAEETIDDFNPFWDLDSANGISSDGRFVVGHGCLDGENVEPWIMELEPKIEIIVNSIADRPRAEDALGCETGEFISNGDPECTLRSAIEAINAGLGDTIEFDIPDVAGIPQISPESPLPALTQPVTIDGSTQPGSDFVWVRGSGAGESGNGISIINAGTTLRGFIVTEFAGSGIQINGGSGYTVEQCILGTDTEGTGGLGNGTGITVLGATDVTIGNNEENNQSSSDGTELPELQAASPRINIGIGNKLNVIAGNLFGVSIENSENVSMHWNLLGTKPTGLEALANSQTSLRIRNLKGFTLGNPLRPTPILGDLSAANIENMTGGAFRNIHINLDTSGENAFSMRPKGLLFKNAKQTSMLKMVAANLSDAGLEFEEGEDLDLGDIILGSDIFGKKSLPLGTGLKVNGFSGLRIGQLSELNNIFNATTGLFLKDLKASATSSEQAQQSDTGVGPRFNIGTNKFSKILLNLERDGLLPLSTMQNGLCIFNSCEIDIDDITTGPITDKAILLESVEKLKVLSAKIGTNLQANTHFPVGFGFHVTNSQGIGFGDPERASTIIAKTAMYLKNLKSFKGTEIVPNSQVRDGYSTRAINIGNSIQNLFVNLLAEGEESPDDTAETGICIENSCDFDMDNISIGRMNHGFLVSNSENLALRRTILGTNPFGTKVFPLGFGFHGTNLKGLSFGDSLRRSLIKAKTGLFLKNLKKRLAETDDGQATQSNVGTRFNLNIGTNKIFNSLFNLSADGEQSLKDDAEIGICLQDSCDVDLDNIFAGRMAQAVQLRNSQLINLRRMMLGTNLLGTKHYPLGYGLHASNSQGIGFGDPDRRSIVMANIGLYLKGIKEYQGTTTIPTATRSGYTTRIIKIGNQVNNLLLNLTMDGEESPLENPEAGICMEDTCNVEMDNLFMGSMARGILARKAERIRAIRMMMGLSQTTQKRFPIEIGIEATDCKGFNFGDDNNVSAVIANIGAQFNNLKAFKGTETVPNSLRGGTSTRFLNIGNRFNNIVFNLGLEGKRPLGSMAKALLFRKACEVKVDKIKVGPTTGNAVEMIESTIMELNDSFIGESPDGEDDHTIGGFAVFMDELSESVDIIGNTLSNSLMGAVKVEGETDDIVIRKNRIFDNLDSILREFNTTSLELIGAFDGSTVFQGTVLGEPGDTVIMDFYSQGPEQTVNAAEVYLGEQMVQLDENGMGEYTAVFKDVTPEDWKVSTTVTDRTRGTSPLSPAVSLTVAPDTDNDGMPDYWEELFHCLDPNNPDDAEEDCDVDGVSNLEEYENGRVPTLDERQIGIGQFDIGDVNSLTFGALDNFEYILECSLTLQPDSWVEVDRVVVEDGGEVTLSDPSPPAASKFYRITGRSL